MALDPEHRKQLAALSIDIVSEFEMRIATDRSADWVRHLHKEVDRRLRMLDRKLQKVRKYAEELKDYAMDAGKENAREESRHKARVQLGMASVSTAAAVLKALDKHNSHTAKAHRDASSNFLAPREDVEVFAMVRLYWFFRHGCDLNSGDSEVLTARLRNAFWIEHGVSRVKYLPNYRDAESKGCEAVRLAVSRFTSLGTK